MSLITYIGKDVEVEKRIEVCDLCANDWALSHDVCTCFASIHTVEKRSPNDIVWFDGPNKLHREMGSVEREVTEAKIEMGEVG
jgi:hypothetical protein